MKHVVTQLSKLVLALVVLYGALLAVTLVVWPRASRSQPLDTGRAAESELLTEPKYVFLGRGRLSTHADRLLILGASNAMAGFKQREVSPLLPNLEVHNLAVGGSNMTQIAQVAELVREVQSPEVRRHNVYVLGLWYGVFAADSARWHTPDRHPGDTDIDIERYRYGFFRRTEQGPVALLPPAYLDLGVSLIHPYLVLDWLARDTTASLRLQLSGKSKPLSDEQRNARVISEHERRKYLDFWHQYMGSTPSLTDAPFERLSACVEQLVTDGSRVILVDMAIPAWHAAGSSLAADYRVRLENSLSKLDEHDRVSVLRMASASTDDDFSDEVHPKPRVSPIWAARLAQAVEQSSKGEEQASRPRADGTPHPRAVARY